MSISGAGFIGMPYKWLTAITGMLSRFEVESGDRTSRRTLIRGNNFFSIHPRIRFSHATRRPDVVEATGASTSTVATRITRDVMRTNFLTLLRMEETEIGG